MMPLRMYLLLFGVTFCWPVRAQVPVTASSHMTVRRVKSSASDKSTLPSVEDLLDRVGNCVQQLEEHLAVVISDETYVQNVWSRQGRGARVSISRRMRSEMLFMWLAQENVWLSIRNVLAVDGRFVPDSKERLDRALAAPAFDAVPRLLQLKAESARFDVGQVWRTTGNPTLVLRFLLPGEQTHFIFTRVDQERIRGETVSKLAFAERDRPTMIDFNGADVLSTGAVWVRPTDGLIVRTNLSLRMPTPLTVSITVDFQRDPKLELWVPSRMEELYQEGDGESTLCSARYSDYRRFETSARLITPN